MATGALATAPTYEALGRRTILDWPLSAAPCQRPLTCPPTWTGPSHYRALELLHRSSYPCDPSAANNPHAPHWPHGEEGPTSAPVDRSGVIRAWLGEGPTVAAEIQCALRPLL